MDTENKEKSVDNIIIEGVVKSAYIGKTKFSDKVKNRIAVQSDNIPYDQIIAYKEAGNKLTPAWYKDRTGYINLASIYNIPVMGIKNDIMTFEEFTENERSIGSKIRMSITQKEGSVYPKAIKILELGEERDPFEGL
jgi:hypothetical protein